MTNAAKRLFRVVRDNLGPQPPDAVDRHTEEALEAHKREGLDLAVKARWVALSIIALLLPFINFSWEIVYYEFLLCCFAFIGWLQKKVGTVGRSPIELLLMFCDLLLMTIVCIAPNPFAAVDWPLAMQYRFENFIYFFVLLGSAALAYSWRTVQAMGSWTAVLWGLGLLVMWYFSGGSAELSDAAMAAYGENQRMASILDPNNLRPEVRLQEIVVFMIVAHTVALTVRRAGQQLRRHAAVERERANLARYFSPNVVDQLSHNDEPLKQVRTQEIAVLFVDIVGFTAYAADKAPEEVIATLRGFHAAMEREVFRHHGTLDKYLGDGLMATFGTPSSGPSDARNALDCARAMIAALQAWNEERLHGGEPAIRAGFGLHYGPAVLGDVGANRLEFAVIGNTVNIASRLEALTRPLDVTLIASHELVAKARAEGGDDWVFDGLQPVEGQAIRGVAAPMAVWTLA